MVEEPFTLDFQNDFALTCDDWILDVFLFGICSGLLLSCSMT